MLAFFFQIGDCLENVLKDLPGSPPDFEALRLYLLLPICHVFSVPQKYLAPVIMPYATAINKLRAEALKILCTSVFIFTTSRR